jgi:hypothetical protein
MWLQDAPAQTLGYMTLGFGVIFGTMGLFILSLWLRFRNLRRDLDFMQEIDGQA